MPIDIISRIYSCDVKLFLTFLPIHFDSISKYDDLKLFINHPFMTSTRKDEIINTFSKIQRLVFAVGRLKRAWLYKRARIYNTDDLFMSPISCEDKNVFVLLQNKTKYIFHLRELLCIIVNSLSHCCHFFPDPTLCKNPYTNLALDKSALYNIYFAIRASGYAMPILFERYFQKNFDLERFLIENQDLISEEYLKTYVENHCTNLYVLCREMFVDNHMKFNIHISFPRDKLLKIMKPYLDLYLVSQYSFHPQKKLRAFRTLHSKLHKFIKFNSNFGKRKVRIVTKNPFGRNGHCEYYFDEEYIPFTPLCEDVCHHTPVMSPREPDSSSSSSSSSDEYPVIVRHMSTVIPVNIVVNEDEDEDEDEDEGEDDDIIEDTDDDISFHENAEREDGVDDEI